MDKGYTSASWVVTTMTCCFDRRMSRGVGISLLLILLGGPAACESESALAQLREGCTLSSDCDGALVCASGICHEACNSSKDCPAGRCIVDRGVHLPANFQAGVDLEADRARGFRVTPGGVVLLTPDMLGQPLHTTR